MRGRRVTAAHRSLNLSLLEPMTVKSSLGLRGAADCQFGREPQQCAALMPNESPMTCTDKGCFQTGAAGGGERTRDRRKT